MPQEETFDIIDDSEESLLASQRNSSIANFITHEALKKYYELYKRRWVPMSFIEFYFSEYKSYEFLSKTFLKDFFSLYTTEDIPSIVENYMNCYYCLIVKKENKKDELCYFISDRDYMFVRLSDEDVLGRFDPELYKNLENITIHMEKNDELITLKEMYESFMIRKVVLSYKPNIKPSSIKTSAKVAPSVTKAVDISDAMLVGNKSDVPNQKGRVVKLYFPKLALPSAYPILLEKSRINSDHRASRFMPTDKQVTLINKYKFNRVKYRQGFIEKRKAASKPKRKFEFDF